MRYAIPDLIKELVAAGVRPGDARSAEWQNPRPLVSPEFVRRFAAEVDQIYLYAPPFRTIADDVSSSRQVVVDRYWKVFGALDQITPEKALLLGDFGLGSDAPIILDYARDSLDPPVLRLRYGAGRRTDWVQGARNLAEFASILGLTSGEGRG
jgi:hypothetical protein